MNFWIVWMNVGMTLEGVQAIKYLTENGTWTNVRSEARTFYDIVSASRVAERYGGKVERR